MALLGYYLPIGAGSTGSLGKWSSLPMLLVLLVAVLLGLVAQLGREGRELSSDNRRYRRYFDLLGWRWGRWQPLPPVVGVTLKFFTEVAKGDSTSWGIWDTSGQRYQKLVLLLSLQDSREGLVLNEFNTDELAVTRQAAQELATRFGVPVHEYLAPQRTRRR